MSGTTSIDNLPISPQTDNIRMDTTEKNIQIENNASNLQESRDNDPSVMQKNMNQFVTGIQQASAAGLTTLPSRDIPTNQDHILQDVNTKPNFIPTNTNNNDNYDYIEDHMSTQDIINSHNKNEKNNNRFDSIFDEFQTPVLLGILYFLFQLPVIQKQICRVLPSLYNTDGNPSLSGYVFTSSLFASVYYFLVKSMYIIDN